MVIFPLRKNNELYFSLHISTLYLTAEIWKENDLYTFMPLIKENVIAKWSWVHSKEN